MSGGDSLVVVVSRLVWICKGYLVPVSLVKGMGYQHKGVLVVVLGRSVLWPREVGPSP